MQVSVPQLLIAKKNGGHKLYEERQALEQAWNGKIRLAEV